MTKTIFLLLFLPLVVFSYSKEPTRREVADHLQNISVTIRADGEYQKSEGSGVLATRKVGGVEMTFVWTAAHVVDSLRSVREVVDEKGDTHSVVEFKDAQIIKELVEGGRRVGEVKMDARVIKYSDSDHGEDLALLMVRATGYSKDGCKFYLEKSEPIIPIGTQLFHVGSLLGQLGSNSMTSGIISQIGRTYGKVEFDQTTVTAFPGSSGGGVYLEDGRYVGMLVRGVGEQFNLIVPIRRMKKWAAKNSILWAIDESVATPSLEKIISLPLEGAGKHSRKGDKKSLQTSEASPYPFLIKITTNRL
jgi:S1-C subfamily serine protease|tara:strand:+ start:538 stop:1452 length:915 start_codon:yes stop_codon:yes gene_type:complete